MIPAQRQAAILQRLSNGEVASIAELMEEFQVSHMTIRRDIGKLEQEGVVTSVSGGVQSNSVLQKELSRTKKLQRHHNEKRAIGQYACSLIPQGATIYLDAGTTTFFIAEGLLHRGDLTIITNDFPITNILIEHSTAEIYHSGGKIDKRNASSIGDLAAKMLLQFNIDIAFISTSSFDCRGISTPSEEKISVKVAVVEASKKRVLVSDSSKFGKVATFHAIDLDEFDTVISDKNIPVEMRETCAQRNIELVALDY